MLFLHSLILAIIQGITEFLPISSSGHLAVMPMFMDWQDQGLLIDVSVHVGTLLAVMIYFKRDVAMLARGGLSTLKLGYRKNSDDAKMFQLLALASIPVLVVGAALAFSGYGEIFRRPDIIAAASIGFGVLLYWADQKGAISKTLSDLSLKPAVIVGLAQVLALIPGTSRSGITMTAGRMLGYKRTEAARFSMLLSIPAIMAAGGWATLQLIQIGNDGKMLEALFAATAAFLTALAAIHFLMRWLTHASMTIFVVYRVLFGILILILVL